MGEGGREWESESQKTSTAGVADLHDTLKVEVEFLKKSSFCGFRVKKK